MLMDVVFEETPAPSSWQDGLGLQDFEDFATLRRGVPRHMWPLTGRGPGVLRPGAGEEDFFYSAPQGPQGPQGYPAQPTEPAEHHSDGEPETTAPGLKSWSLKSIRGNFMRVDEFWLVLLFLLAFNAPL